MKETDQTTDRKEHKYYNTAVTHQPVTTTKSIYNIVLQFNSVELSILRRIRIHYSQLSNIVRENIGLN